MFPGIHQIVTLPTRKQKILDFISTDLYSFYLTPEITSSLGPDDPSKAKKSDHLIPIAKPRTTDNNSKAGAKKIITKRPMPKSAIDEFGRWIGTQEWNELSNELNVTQLTEKLINIVQSKVDEIFPLKTCRVPANNKPWFNNCLLYTSPSPRDS